VVDHSLELLQPLGITAPKVEFRLPQFTAAAAKVTSFLRPKMTRGFVVLNPGAGWPSKVWPAEGYGTVAQHLGKTWSLPSIVVWAGDQEREYGQTIVAHSGGHATLAPQTNLQELSEVLRQSRLFVGSDTGPLHLAAAVGTPCVSMYGPTRPAHCGPYGHGHVALQEYLQTGTCRQRRRADNVAMRAIRADTVCKACDQVLDRQGEDADGQAA
jgi:ADP-heptose:LPS heptosyltransferase